MNQIALLCKNGQKFGMHVSDLSSGKIVRKIEADLKVKVFIDLRSYEKTYDENLPMLIRSEQVLAVVADHLSNLAVPNKKQLVGMPEC